MDRREPGEGGGGGGKRVGGCEGNSAFRAAAGPVALRSNCVRWRASVEPCVAFMTGLIKAFSGYGDWLRLWLRWMAVMPI